MIITFLFLIIYVRIWGQMTSEKVLYIYLIELALKNIRYDFKN